MTPDSSSKLIEWAASTIKHGVFLTYEQIYPDDAFGRVMMKHFDVIGSQLKTIRHFPTISDQIHRYQCSGWFYVKAMDVNYFFHNYLTKQERSRIYHLEPFDEFEEWHLKCMHYMVLTAFSGECIGFAGNLWPREYLTRAGNTDVMVELESMTTVTESDNGQLSVTKTLGNDDGLSENSDATLRVVCGDIMDSKSAAEQEALDDDLPGDVYTWDSVFTDEELLTPLNKRFAHTASLILMPNKPSQPNHSTTDSDIKSKNLCRVAVASQGASVTSHISIPSSSSGLGEADSAAAGHGTVFSLSESADCYQLLAKQAYIMCVGGFGQQDDKHGRLSGLYFISLGTGKSVDVEYSGEACSFDRMYHSITNISESKLVMFGGRHSPAKPCNPASIWVLSCNVGQSEQQDKICCKCEVVQTMGATPCARWRHSAVEIKCQGRQYIFVYGGRTSDSMTLNDIHILDTDKWAWNKVEACGVLPQPTHSHTADVWRDSILITGGLTENEVAMDTIQQLKIPSSLDNKWIWSKLNVTGSFKPRYSHSSAVIGDHLFVVGGVSLCYPPPDITVINLLTSSIQSFNQPHRGAGPITMLHKHASVVVHQEDKAEMYIIGGGGNCFSFGTHFNQTPILFTIKNSKV